MHGGSGSGSENSSLIGLKDLDPRACTTHDTGGNEQHRNYGWGHLKSFLTTCVRALRILPSNAS